MMACAGVAEPLEGSGLQRVLGQDEEERNEMAQNFLLRQPSGWLPLPGMGKCVLPG